MKNGRILHGLRKGSRNDEKIRGKRKLERKSNDIRVVQKGRFVKKKI